MKKEILIIILLFALSGINLWLNLRPDEKQIEDPNYEVYKLKFETLQNRIDSLRVQVISFEQETDSIKIQIINDESKVDHASNNDVDSMFNALFTRHK